MSHSEAEIAIDAGKAIHDGQVVKESASRKLAKREVYAFIALCLGLCLLALSGVFIWKGSNADSDDTLLRIENAAYQLMLADEMAKEDGAAAAAERLENIGGLILQKDGNTTLTDLVPIAESAEKLRTAMMSDDRKSAVEELVRFKDIAAELDAKKFQSASQLHDREYGVIMLIIGQMTALIAGIYLYLASKTSIEGSIAAGVEGDALRQRLEESEKAFDIERRATTELRQKMIDQGRLLREIEGQHRLAKTPQSAPPPPIPVGDMTNHHESERKKWMDSEAQLREQIKNLEGALDRTQKDLLAVSEERNRLDASVKDVKAASVDLASMRERLLAAEMSAKKYETDYTVLEWTNTKLKGLNEELSAEVNRLKDEMASEFKRFRDQLADLRG